jgi:hypothetical protein
LHSGWLPRFPFELSARILGALMALGGLGWLTLVSPMLVNYLAPYNLAFSLLGEGAVCLWVLLTRANVGRGASALRKPTSNGAEAAGQYLIR